MKIRIFILLMSIFSFLISSNASADNAAVKIEGSIHVEVDVRIADFREKKLKKSLSVFSQKAVATVIDWGNMDSEYMGHSLVVSMIPKRNGKVHIFGNDAIVGDDKRHGATGQHDYTEYAIRFVAYGPHNNPGYSDIVQVQRVLTAYSNGTLEMDKNYSPTFNFRGNHIYYDKTGQKDGLTEYKVTIDISNIKIKK